MAKISFKSVGQTQQQVVETTPETTQPPIGIKTPLRLGDEKGNLLAMHYDVGDQLADNLRNLLLTNWGERLGLYYFGANLRPLTTEFTNQTNFDNEAIVRIKNAVTTWMPYIELEEFASETDRNNNYNKGMATITLTISYNVPTLQQNNRVIQVVLYVL
jgi:phage baseplate assembly protein W